MTWEGLTPPYRTIVADPPWDYGFNSRKGTWPPTNAGAAGAYRNAPLPYSTMSTTEIAALPVAQLAHQDGAHLYLWTTQRLMRSAYEIAEAWGFAVRTVLVWSKPAKGISGDFVCSAEFVLYGKRGSLPALSRHMGTVFDLPRPAGHSTKPPAFLDVVEGVSPGPYVELFARAPRLGWDSWGYGYESGAA
jgi:N6-adenosine-specific RNA methylase IME4